MKKDGYKYVLRYYLPVRPIYDEGFTEKRFEKLLKFCRKANVDAVMFFVAHNPQNYYMPDTPEYALTWQAQMIPYIKRLREAGIGYQINFQDILGMETGGADVKDKYDWEYMVDHTGRTTPCGCPIGKKFRENTKERLQIWAKTQPDVIWIDDDFRMHNHGGALFARSEGKPPYIDRYCYCDNHIRLFNEKYNTNYDRETLVNEILQEGEPSWARKAYFDFVGETMVDTASWVSSTIRSVSPKTRVAQMVSQADAHTNEARNWNAFLTAISGGDIPMVRTGLGPYFEYDRLDYCTAYMETAQMQAQIRETYMDKVEYCPEVENTRYTVWSKSASATTYQMFLGAFLGGKAITLALHDLDGGAFEDEPRYEEMLRRQKPFLDKIVGLGLDQAEDLGVIIPTCGDSAKRYHLTKGENFNELCGRQRYIEKYLMNIGIPCRYANVKELNEKGCVALDRYAANFLTDDELRTILQGGVFLDGGAAEVLIGRGFAEQIGVKTIKRKNVFLQAENINLFTRNDGTNIRIPCRVPINCWFEIETLEGTKVFSTFLDKKGDAFKGLTFFDNSLGGRVAVYPMEKDFGVSGFYTHHRVNLIKDTFEKLCSTLPRINTESFTLVATRKKGDEVYYALTNLATDDSESYCIDGIIVKERLKIYQTAVYVKKKGKLIKIGKSKR